MAAGGTEHAYDRIARYYDLLFDDWGEALRAEGARLDAILGPLSVRSVLDGTCGTGLQCIGLALKGYSATGVDSSPAMLRRARANGRTAGAQVTWVLGDMRRLAPGTVGRHDAAISCGNSLSHFHSVEDLGLALRSAYGVVRPGGWCLVDTWDYRDMMARRPATVGHRVKRLAGREVVLFDTREYAGNVVHTTYHLLRRTSGGWAEHSYSMDLRAWSKDEVAASLRLAGFPEVEDLTAGSLIQLLGRKDLP